MLTVIRRILSYTKPCRKELLGMLLFALIGTGLSLFVPILIGKAVDCVVAVHEVDFPQLWKIIIVLALTIAVSACPSVPTVWRHTLFVICGATCSVTCSMSRCGTSTDRQEEI